MCSLSIPFHSILYSILADSQFTGTTVKSPSTCSCVCVVESERVDAESSSQRGEGVHFGPHQGIIKGDC